jgi:hypothetical protein
MEKTCWDCKYSIERNPKEFYCIKHLTISIDELFKLSLDDNPYLYDDDEICEEFEEE